MDLMNEQLAELKYLQGIAKRQVHKTRNSPTACRDAGRFLMEVLREQRDVYVSLSGDAGDAGTGAEAVRERVSSTFDLVSRD